MKVYKHKKTGKEVKAKQIGEPVEVHLADGPHVFLDEDYEVHTPLDELGNHSVTMWKREDFERQHTEVKNGEKKGGD